MTSAENIISYTVTALSIVGHRASGQAQRNVDVKSSQVRREKENVTAFNLIRAREKKSFSGRIDR